MKQKFSVASKYATLALQSNNPGTYKYTFTGVSDGLYSQQSMKAFDFTPLVIEQTVNPLPTVSFVEKGKTYKICVNSEPDDENVEAVPIALSGKGPFSVKMTIHHDDTGKSSKFEIADITSKKHLITSIYKNLGLGKHTLRFNSITDSNGCGRSSFRDDEKVYIFVSDVPYLAQINPQTDYCVGDHLSFALNGVPPFEVTYDFNGKKQKAITSTPFSRLAAVPGNLTLLTLKDSSSSCLVKLSETNVKRIHEVPSVVVSEGTTIIQDIHEGDQAEIIFTLKGTPPFNFVYTRSECTRKGRCKVVETNMVNDVQSHEYVIYTSMQGTYEAISVEDKYCSVTSK